MKNVLLIILALLIIRATVAKQTQPDKKRIAEIQAALVAHGYQPGKTWQQTQEILRGIAQSHDWQVKRAPDARVLILLDLGNAHSDPDVIKEGANHLDYKKAEDPEEN